LSAVVVLSGGDVSISSSSSPQPGVVEAEDDGFEESVSSAEAMLAPSVGVIPKPE
jgi:hypothetical protein